MKKYIFLSLTLIAFSFTTFGQTDKGTEIPEALVKTLLGEMVSTKQFVNDGNPIILSFWATWCKPCIRELSNIMEEYEDWQDETGVKIIAVSIDDARNAMKVAPFINGQGWEYEVYLDENSDFRRLLNVNNIPHTFLIDGNLNIVWQHNGYAEGDETELYKLVKKLSAGESIQDAH
jgi:thiol-disulfide isomerase/thioredoxin